MSVMLCTGITNLNAITGQTLVCYSLHESAFPEKQKCFCVCSEHKTTISIQDRLSHLADLVTLVRVCVCVHMCVQYVF